MLRPIVTETSDTVVHIQRSTSDRSLISCTVSTEGKVGPNCNLIRSDQISHGFKHPLMTRTSRLRRRLDVVTRCPRSILGLLALLITGMSFAGRISWFGWVRGYYWSPKKRVHSLLVLRHFYVFAPAPWVLVLPPFAERTEPAAAANVVDRVAVPTDRLKPSVRPGFSPFRGQLFVWLGTLG